MNPPPPISTLGEQDYLDINRALGELERLRVEIQKAAQAGCDVTDPNSHCNHLISQFNRLKSVYFPGRP